MHTQLMMPFQIAPKWMTLWQNSFFGLYFHRHSDSQTHVFSFLYPPIYLKGKTWLEASTQRPLSNLWFGDNPSTKMTSRPLISWVILISRLQTTFDVLVQKMWVMVLGCTMLGLLDLLLNIWWNIMQTVRKETDYPWLTILTLTHSRYWP